jgi:DNA topoisomerase IA
MEIMKNINTIGREADYIFLCSDEDREGEAISYHIYTELTSENRKKAIRRSLKD